MEAWPLVGLRETDKGQSTLVDLGRHSVEGVGLVEVACTYQGAGMAEACSHGKGDTPGLTSVRIHKVEVGVESGREGRDKDYCSHFQGAWQGAGCCGGSEAMVEMRSENEQCTEHEEMVEEEQWVEHRAESETGVAEGQ